MNMQSSQGWAASTSRMLLVIMVIGPRVMAACPGGVSRPGLVTVPTPCPPVMRIGFPAGPFSRVTTAPISAPWVMSGSSPASLITVHRADAADVSRHR